jgi:hypothetical protein
MYPTSRILWRKASLEYLRVLLAKHDGQAIRMRPSAPKSIPSWIPQAQIGYQGIYTSKKGFWVQVQHNCLCTQAFCANNNYSSFFHSLVARTSWSYLQCASTSSLPWTNAWLSSNFRGNIFISLFFQSCPSLLIRILWFFTGFSTCPTCQDNLL